MAQYKTYAKIEIMGVPDYIAGVTRCLDVIDGVPDGRKLLQSICTRGHMVYIQDTITGNSCTLQKWSACPLLPLAIAEKSAQRFATELTVAVGKAKSGGLTLEHLARQLAVGLSPATYASAANVVPPTQKAPARPGASPKEVMSHAARQTAAATSILQDLMSSKRPLHSLPPGWDYELPRLLRNYLTPGSGSGSKVAFNHAKTFHCVDDPAMHLRPPAIGLAHELIHALHNSSGVNMKLVAKNGENIEEIITTGMPPYNFEGLSDNKMRTQWPSHMALRVNY